VASNRVAPHPVKPVAFAHLTGGEQKSKQFLFKIQNACYVLSHSPDLAAARATPVGKKEWATVT
jgi:hypothetical protein